MLTQPSTAPWRSQSCVKSSSSTKEGLRLPGSLDAFELAVRAVLGQQVTVAAARTLAVLMMGGDLIR